MYTVAQQSSGRPPGLRRSRRIAPEVTARGGGAAVAADQPRLFGRLSTRLGNAGFGTRYVTLPPTAQRELLTRGLPGTATVLGVRSCRSASGHRFRVRIQLKSESPYETRVRQRVDDAALISMRPGDIIGCRVDPGDRDRVVLYVPLPEPPSRVGIAKVLAHGRRADATVLAATPVAVDYSGGDPVLRLDLELRAWDETRPWRVRILQPVPLSAIELVDLGGQLEVAFFTVDHGASVAVDWDASSVD